MMLMFVKCNANVEAKHLGCYSWDLCNPRPGVLVESVKDAWLKSLEDHAIGTLDLAISMWMSDRVLVDPDAVSITKV